MLQTLLFILFYCFFVCLYFFSIILSFIFIFYFFLIIILSYFPFFLQYNDRRKIVGIYGIIIIIIIIIFNLIHDIFIYDQLLFSFRYNTLIIIIIMTIMIIISLFSIITLSENIYKLFFFYIRKCFDLVHFVISVVDLWDG